MRTATLFFALTMLGITACSSDNVEPCTPDCTGRICGTDGCGGSCGTCPSNNSNALTCTQSGICKCDPTCTPNCSGRACGDDGCGGSCGACSAGSVCTYDRGNSPNWQCEAFSGISSRMNFFVSSIGNGDSGGDFGGLPGADALCQMLAEAAGVTGKTWRAYLSTGTVNARTRIGSGPWYNAWDRPLVDPACASSSPDCLTRLHTNGILAENVVTEFGTQLDWANAHDIFTGSDQNGNNTGANCDGWTSSSENVNATVGHSYGQRAGASESWNSAHDTQCDRVGAQCTAGQSHVYCFAP